MPISMISRINNIEVVRGRRAEARFTNPFTKRSPASAGQRIEPSGGRRHKSLNGWVNVDPVATAEND